MRNVCASAACIVLCLSLAASPAMANDEKCKQVFASFGKSTYIMDIADCDVFIGRPGVYEKCVEAPIQGTLNGSWVFYDPGDNLFTHFDLADLHPGFGAAWGFSAFKTEHGELWTRDTWVADFGGLPYFYFSQVSWVFGGTGIYEGATGHLGLIGDDDEGIIRGEVCTIK